MNRCTLQRRLRNFLRKHSDEFLDGQHSAFWSEFVSQHCKPARGPSELCTNVSWFAYLSRTQHSQSRGAHGGKRWLNLQAIYGWQWYASVPNHRDVIWRAILPYRGKSNPHSGFGHWKWRSELLALESIPMEPLGCHAVIPGWQHTSIKLATHTERSGFAQFLASCYLKGQR